MDASIILLFYLAGATITVLLFAFPKTRPAGYALLGAGALIALSLIWWMQVGTFSYEQSAFNEKPITSLGPPSEAVPASNGEKPPSWVNAAPRSVGDAYQISAAVGPYTTRVECDAQLPAELQKALDRYVEACVGGEAGERIVLPTDYLSQLIKDRWEESRQHEFGGINTPMTTLHVLVEFDRKAKDRVLDEIRRAQVSGRIWSAGLVWFVWLALLGGAYGWLKFSGGGKDRRES